VKDSGNNVIVQVKENQQQLLDDCRVTAQNETPLSVYAAPPESGRGRIEQRGCRVFECAFTTDPQWQTLIAQIVEVRRVRECFNTRTKCWERSEEIAFYISTTRRSAQEYNTIIRQHWAIENRQHRVRDGAFREDESRIRKNPAIMAMLRSFALNVFRANRIGNIQKQAYAYAINFNATLSLSHLWN